MRAVLLFLLLVLGCHASYTGYCRRCIFGFEHDCVIQKGTGGVGIPPSPGTEKVNNPFENLYPPHTVKDHNLSPYLGVRGQAQLATYTFGEKDFWVSYMSVVYDSINICTQRDHPLRVVLVENGCSQPPILDLPKAEDVANHKKNPQIEVAAGMAICPNPKELHPLEYYFQHSTTQTPGHLNYPLSGTSDSGIAQFFNGDTPGVPRNPCNATQFSQSKCPAKDKCTDAIMWKKHKAVGSTPAYYTYPVTAFLTDDAENNPVTYSVFVSPKYVLTATFNDDPNCHMGSPPSSLDYIISPVAAGFVKTELNPVVSNPIPKKRMSESEYAFGKAEDLRKTTGSTEAYHSRLLKSEYVVTNLAGPASTTEIIRLDQACEKATGTTGEWRCNDDVGKLEYLQFHREPFSFNNNAAKHRWMAALVRTGKGNNAPDGFMIPPLSYSSPYRNIFDRQQSVVTGSMWPDILGLFPIPNNKEKIDYGVYETSQPLSLASSVAEVPDDRSSPHTKASINYFYTNYVLWCNIGTDSGYSGKSLVPEQDVQSMSDYFSVNSIKWPSFGPQTIPSAKLYLEQLCCAGAPSIDDQGGRYPNGTKNLRFIPCQISSSEICSCSRGLTGLLCNETIDPGFDTATATACPKADICMGRGRCVVKPGGVGVHCVCRPGWWGGGSRDDPLAGTGTGTHPINNSVMVDLYAFLLLDTCAVKDETYTIETDPETDWLLRYPSLHQCMLWGNSLDVDSYDDKRWTGIFYTMYDDKGVLSTSYTKVGNDLAYAPGMPSFPYDCAAYLTYLPDGADVPARDGPVYGGWWCNRCPDCFWDNTEYCGDADPVKAWQAPDRFHADAATKCHCKEGWTGLLCEISSCPRFGTNDTYWLGKDKDLIDTSPCLSASGRGVCRVAEYYRNQGPTVTLENRDDVFYVFNWSWSPLSVTYEYPYITYDLRFNSSVKQEFTGVCDCKEGYYGPRCEKEECPRDEPGEVCGIGGTCLVDGEIDPVYGVPNGTERWLYHVIDTWAWQGFDTESDCLGVYVAGITVPGGGVAYANQTTSSGPFWNQPGPYPQSYPYTGCAYVAADTFLNKQNIVFHDLGKYGHWLPYFDVYGGTSLSNTTARSCHCVKKDPTSGKYVPSGYVKGPKGLCNVRACPINSVSGLECNGLTRADDPSTNVCNRDAVNPVCECWRALPGPRAAAFSGGAAFFNGPEGSCELSYDTVCKNETTNNETCSGEDFSTGCYIDGCGQEERSWGKCQQGLNRSSGVPRCHCKTNETGAYGVNCQISVCGGFPVTMPCSENNAGVISTGTCIASTKTCHCTPPGDTRQGHGVAHTGIYCNVSLAACQMNTFRDACESHGACVDTGGGLACQCSSEYTGTYCETPLACGGLCNLDGGLCIGGTCHCFRNWGGTNCDINYCNLTGGSERGPNLCECPKGSQQYPNHLDEFWKPYPQNVKDPTPDQMNPTHLDSFRGCRRNCLPSEFVQADTECGGYYEDDNGVLLTRCKQLIAYNASVSPVIYPNCTCAGSVYDAVNPNVKQPDPNTPSKRLKVPWVSVGGDFTYGGSTCRPECVYCFTNPLGGCNINVCTGLDSNATELQGQHGCQYHDTYCSVETCSFGEAHPDHTWDSATQKCECNPPWQWDNSSICTLEHNMCVMTGGQPPPSWNISSHVSESCLCQYPFRTDNSDEASPTFRLCVPNCGEAGTAAKGDTSCTCAAGGMYFGAYCNQTLCNATRGEVELVRDSSNKVVYAGTCQCKYKQWGGTYCNTSLCVGGVPKALPGQGCDCFLGWRGDLCDAASGCGAHGTASNSSADAVCVCDPGWGGTQCQINRCEASLTTSTGLDHGTSVSGRIRPVPCSSTQVHLPDCVYPNLNYNCPCGELITTFDNVTGGCINTTHINCVHGRWAVHAHNDTPGCQCQPYYTGMHCEKHVCEDVHANYVDDHFMVQYSRVHNDDGLLEYDCECHEPAYVYNETQGRCVANCSYFFVTYNETWLHPLPREEGHGCYCPDPDYLPDHMPPTWLHPSYNETQGLHCRFACHARRTFEIKNNSCVCVTGYTGRFCQDVITVAVARIDYDTVSTWVPAILPAMVLISVATAAVYTVQAKREALRQATQARYRPLRASRHEL